MRQKFALDKQPGARPNYMKLGRKDLSDVRGHVTDVHEAISDFKQILGDLADLKADLLARRTAGLFRDVVMGIMSAIAGKAGVSNAKLTVDAAKEHLLEGMSPDDFCRLKELYEYGHSFAHPPDDTTYDSLEDYLEEHRKIPVELSVGKAADLKPLFQRVIEWGRACKVPPKSIKKTSRAEAR